MGIGLGAGIGKIDTTSCRFSCKERRRWSELEACNIAKQNLKFFNNNIIIGT